MSLIILLCIGWLGALLLLLAFINGCNSGRKKESTHFYDWFSYRLSKHKEGEK